MTGNIISDFFVYLAIAGVGACLTYGGWQLLLDKLREPSTRH